MRIRFGLLATAVAATFATPSFGSVVINEIAYHGTSDHFCDGEDWIELLNTGVNAVDLTNYILHDNRIDGEDASILSSGIGPGDVLLLCKDTNFEFGIGYSDTVNLVDPTGKLVDFVALPGTGSDEETYNLVIDSNTGESLYFYSTTPTPGAPNVITGILSLKEKVKSQNEEGANPVLDNAVADINVLLDEEERLLRTKSKKLKTKKENKKNSVSIDGSTSNPERKPDVIELNSKSSKDVKKAKKSEAPSDAPSYAPTETPSYVPSTSPSDDPSSNPSGSPSAAPSSSPSEPPSDSPSNSPSMSPTTSPSYVPSTSPSDDPSSNPSASPSAAPSSSPSEPPSDSPSNSPSMSPTTSPSHAPSTSPSVDPSASPTEPPTDSPTSSPTRRICTTSSECSTGFCAIQSSGNVCESNCNPGGCAGRTAPDNSLSNGVYCWNNGQCKSELCAQGSDLLSHTCGNNCGDRGCRDCYYFP